MNPVAFTLFGISVRWYGIFIAISMLVGIILANYTCKYRNLYHDSIISVALIALPVSIIGARLYYVFFQFGYYKNHLSEIPNIRMGGLAIHGGVLFALIATLIYAKHKKLNFLKITDVASPSLVFAQAIGRLGNFMNGDGHGGPVSYNFIKHFPILIQKGMLIDGIYYNPTFLYETLWNIFVFIILLIMLMKVKKIGFVFFSYIGLYSVGRFFIEGLRTDSLMIGPIRIAQLVSILCIFFWIISIKFYYFTIKERID